MQPLDMSDVPDHISDRPVSAPMLNYNYPFAAAPDIIRSHQKDAYFQGVLLDQLSHILRRLYGARFLHSYTTEARTFSDFLYLALTTLIGNRTLGEEYCDIIQVEDDTLRLPAISRRAGYIVSSVLLPYTLNRILPTFRSRVRSKLESNLRRLTRFSNQKSVSYNFQSYVLEHLSDITSPSPIHAITLTIFYFSGAYYQLSKRLIGLRYIFTKRIEPSEARVGYEVLGVLLLLQLSVQSWLHMQSTFRNATSTAPALPANASVLAGSSAMIGHGVELPLDPPLSNSDNELLVESSTSYGASSISLTTHTPTLKSPHYHLASPTTMKWIQGHQQRKCTLCLEELKDPGAPLCGHVFCWSCIANWIREKPECPLCRRSALPQHILALRS